MNSTGCSLYSCGHCHLLLPLLDCLSFRYVLFAGCFCGVCEEHFIDGNEQRAYGCPRLNDGKDEGYCCGSSNTSFYCCAEVNESIYKLQNSTINGKSMSVLLFK